MKYLWLLAALVLAGCGTTGKQIQTELVFRDNTNCVFHLYPAVSTESGDNVNTSSNKTDLKDLVKIPFVESPLDVAADGVEANIVADVASKLGSVVTESTTPVVEIDEVVTMQPYESKSFAWLKETGYGKNVTFTFDNGCGSITVPDGAVSHTPNGNLSDYNQIVYFCGTDFPEGSAENNQGRASIFTAPGCVASKVTITRE